MTVLTITDKKGLPFRVFMNPSKAQTRALLKNPIELKGLISKKSLYVWDAFFSHHSYIIKKLGLNEIDCEFIIHDGRVDGRLYLDGENFKEVDLRNFTRADYNTFLKFFDPLPGNIDSVCDDD